MNDKTTPVELPQNAWTQMIERVAARNAGGGSLSDMEISAGVPVTGTPMPTVRSADLGRTITPPPPLTEEEIQANIQEAVAAGFIQPPNDHEGSNYGSLEEAIRAGAPVTADAEQIAAGAARFAEAPAPVRSPRMAIGAAAGPSRQTAREYVETLQPRIPDFKKVQAIDLINGKVYVDSLEFAVSPTELKQLRKFCITKAKEQVQAALDAALAEDEDGGGTPE